MKAGRVIGKVILSQMDPGFRGGSWLLVSPMGADQLKDRKSGYGQASTPVVFDQLGAGVDDPILYVEGAEATQPFAHDIPLDAISVALLDNYHYDPIETSSN